ncbi:hypothetical protein GJ688_12955 [Heliobacillus mobilis]|uniref:Uncharacterized protein n=1 Tax=Heliobacterium mobile TaxID=28064 RepID=A0A6I3SMX0_HELMO|nr:hypothetical protein [Heliobacterium mobile]MTV49882.1 hypothetical protein [Heliobacterium mobile]
MRRWFIYLITGIVFGVFDFYYHGFLSNLMHLQTYSSLAGEITWLVLSIGIWVVPIVPIALYEAKISRSMLRSALANSLTWSAAIVSYYLTNAVQLAFLPTRQELHFSNHSTPFFWDNWKSVIWDDIILGGMVEWIVVAVVGGFIIGFLICFIYNRIMKTRTVQKESIEASETNPQNL